MRDPVSDVVDMLAGDGWSGLEDLEKQMRETNARASAADREQAEREAAIVAAALETDAGRKLLGLLLHKTLLRAPADDEIGARGSAEAYAIAKAKREGQNAIVFMLLQMLQFHHGKIENLRGEP